MDNEVARNDPCPCGSGRRYKYCHGSLGAAPPANLTEAPLGGGGLPRGHRARPRRPHPLHPEALAAHRAGMLSRAEALYQRALRERPDDAELLHMLGVLEFERMHYYEALELLANANDRTSWTDSVMRQNLGLVIAKLVGPRADARQRELVERYLERERTRNAAPPAAERVSVVLLADGVASGVAASVESIAVQTNGNIELVVATNSRADLETAIAAWPDASSPVVVEARGRTHAANLAAECASGTWVAFLESGDRHAPERIVRMTSEIAGGASRWGFSWIGNLVEFGGTGDTKFRPGDHRGDEPASFTLLHRDLVRTIGNLFVQREFFLDLGGLRDVVDPAWDFALRASRISEPVPVASRLYFRSGPPGAGAHGASSGSRRSRAQLDAAADGRVADALQGDPSATNIFCPQHPANCDLVLRSELRAGRGDRIPLEVLRTTAAELCAKAASGPRVVAPLVTSSSNPSADGRIALVVLGVYRSGTSAIARALNLCGAALPERVIAPRLAINPTGFWEAEAVTDLDVCLLHRLGADWNTPDVRLPHEGPLVDEFLDRVREILAREYGNAKLILIKDPRICMLVPLWHRALVASSYRPAYLVAVRHPLEVARSFEGQGDMPVAAGLALWHAYMERVEAFTAGVDARVAWVRYTALLDDWRHALASIASRLDVALETRSRAVEIDTFLDRGMRNHRAEDDALVDGAAATPDRAESGGLLQDEVRQLYRRLIERCEGDAQDVRSR